MKLQNPVDVKAARAGVAPPDYWAAGGPPSDWHRYRVLDASSGEELPDVIEVDAVEGWCRRYCLDAAGKPVYDGATPLTTLERGYFRVAPAPGAY